MHQPMQWCLQRIILNNPASVADDARETEQATAADEFLPCKNKTATQTGTSLEEHAAAIPCDSGLTSADDKPDDPSLIACDGSCAPGKESPRNKECDEVSNMTRDRNTEAAVADGKYCNAKPSPDKDAGKFPVDVNLEEGDYCSDFIFDTFMEDSYDLFGVSYFAGGSIRERAIRPLCNSG